MSITWNERYPIPHLPKQSPDFYTELKKAWFGDSKSHHKGGTVSAFNRKEENKPVQNQVSGLTDQGRITKEPFFIACQLFLSTSSGTAHWWFHRILIEAAWY